MKLFRIFLLMTLLAGCVPTTVGPQSGAPTPTIQRVLQGPAETQAVEATARRYLDAWKSDDYSAMYPLLTEQIRF
jgi:hypothetical protein